jgi:adenosylcobinamide kinase/adenosylcobinamide-phosphate guanylyltransferase
MARRIRRHQKERGPTWGLLEEPLELVRALARAQSAAELVMVDCITLWVSNLMLAGRSEKQIRAEARKLCRILKKPRPRIIVISNEVGSGIVPDNELSRDYRDRLGEVNQMLAAAVNEVYLMVAGIPVRIKGGPE